MKISHTLKNGEQRNIIMDNEKNWTGNKKSTYVTLGASNHTEKDREINDYYATHPSTVKPLFDNEDLNNIWECACGKGHLSSEMEKFGKEVYSTDIIDRGYTKFNSKVDFLKSIDLWWGDIVTNPPYKYAQEFVEKSMEKIQEGRKVAMFLKLQFLEGQKRKELFKKYPPKTIYVFSKRQSCAMNGNFDKYPTSAVAYCWFVWEKGFTGDPIIKWI